MALNLRLDQRMSQSLVMTPRLQQAIKLLQLNHLEMVAHVQEALLENPTLEAVPDSAGSEGAEVEQHAREVATREAADETDRNNGEINESNFEQFLAQMTETSRGPSMSGGTVHEDLPPIETNLTYGSSLSDHLTWQLHMLRLNADEERAATVLVNNLDDRGWLATPLDEVAAEAEVTLDVAAEALEIVQELDPIGCGARSLSECLVVQARLMFPEDENFPRILTHHLHDLERRNYAGIARALGLELEDVVEYHRMIQDLEPHPGRGFVSEEPRYITPDLQIIKHEDEWVVLLNEEGLPELRVSRYYQKVLRGASKQDKEYLIDKLRGAEFLIRSIHKRRRTIRRVMESILKFQRDFFERGGADHLRPLVLQDVADDVGVHMSTVSRVTTNKYVHTPHGIFELKYFFSAAVKQASGGDLAAEAIKARLKGVLAGEDPKDPLSDQAIADLLKKEGVRVARRTVAKYREAMGILPSSQRKQMF
jgi:RNA polymerase sigma-54 factor